jgi:hypothetical protein
MKLEMHCSNIAIDNSHGDVSAGYSRLAVRQ